MGGIALGHAPVGGSDKGAFHRSFYRWPQAAWDRFAGWSVAQARALLAVALLLLAAAAVVPITVGRGEAAKPPSVAAAVKGDRAAAKLRARDDDLALYDRAITRIRHGENYYSFIVSEHRQAFYPVRPGLAVRLPTLAYLDAAMGVDGDAAAPVAMAAALALMCGVIFAWWQRLGDEACSAKQRVYGTVLMFLAGSLGLNRYFFVLHELWAGMLIALSLGLHRPDKGKWLGAWAAAALALAIREHTLPYVMLMAAMAAWRGWGEGDARARAECAAWGALIVAFVAAMAVHLHLIAAQALPTDPIGPSWLAMRGLGGWLSNVALSSNLRFLPHWLAGPAVVAMVLGWAGWKSRASDTATLLFMGYGVLFMVAGRNDNYYWGAIIAPAMFIGFAFLPMAAQSLLRRAQG